MFLDIVSTSNPTFTTVSRMHRLVEIRTQIFQQYHLQLRTLFSQVDLDERRNNFSTRYRLILDLQIAIDLAELMFTYQYFQLDIDTTLDTYPIYELFDTDLYRQKYRDSFVDIGGFDGQTATQFVKNCPNFEAIHLFEPELNNMKVAKLACSALENVYFHARG
jgi:hypothetical protein